LDNRHAVQALYIDEDLGCAVLSNKKNKTTQKKNRKGMRPKLTYSIIQQPYPYAERTEKDPTRFIQSEFKAALESEYILELEQKQGTNPVQVAFIACPVEYRTRWAEVYRKLKQVAFGAEMYFLLLEVKDNEPGPNVVGCPINPRNVTADEQRLLKDLAIERNVYTVLLAYHHETGVWPTAESKTNKVALKKMVAEIRKRFPTRIADMSRAQIMMEQLMQSAQDISASAQQLQKRLQAVQDEKKDPVLAKDMEKQFGPQLKAMDAFLTTCITEFSRTLGFSGKPSSSSSTS